MSVINWSLATVTASTDTTLLQDQVAEETAVFSVIAHNYSGVTINLEVKIMTTGDALKAYIFNDTLDDAKSLFIDSKLFLNEGDKVVVWSDQANVSFIASGDVA